MGEANAEQSVGDKLFQQHCVSCHQPGGVGLSGLAPPLAAAKGSTLSQRVMRPDGRSYILNVLNSGLVGSIEVGGERFSGLMPSFAALSDTELTLIANYVVGELNKEEIKATTFVPYESGELQKVRAEGKKAIDVYRLRQALDGKK